MKIHNNTLAELLIYMLLYQTILYNTKHLNIPKQYCNMLYNDDNTLEYATIHNNIQQYTILNYNIGIVIMIKDSDRDNIADSDNRKIVIYCQYSSVLLRIVRYCQQYHCQPGVLFADVAEQQLGLGSPALQLQGGVTSSGMTRTVMIIEFEALTMVQVRCRDRRMIIISTSEYEKYYEFSKSGYI
jgi:hypothetical protein